MCRPSRKALGEANLFVELHAHNSTAMRVKENGRAIQR